MNKNEARENEKKFHTQVTMVKNIGDEIRTSEIWRKWPNSKMMNNNPGGCKKTDGGKPIQFSGELGPP